MGTTIRVNAKLLETEGQERLPNRVAYVYSANHRLISQGSLNEKGTAAVEVSAKAGSRLHVLVGPEMEETPTLTELRRRGAVETTLTLEDRPTLDVGLDVARFRWSKWFLGLCNVEGHLQKHFSFGPINFNLPVPQAHIEIYEVDPFPKIIFELPDHLIELLRDYILHPIPLPDPPPDFESFTPVPIPRTDIVGFTPVPIPEPPPERSGVLFNRAVARPSGAGKLSAAKMSLASAQQFAFQSKQAVPLSGSAGGLQDLQFLAQRTSTLQFRQVVAQYPVLIRPFLCYLFPMNVTMQLVATAITDECGDFHAHFFRGFNNPDQPDLYFRAKQQIHFGPMTTIYSPSPIACFTYWDYICGTHVTLTTHHPEAIVRSACIDLSDGVIVDRVGDYPLNLIRGTSANLAPTTGASNLGLTQDGAPWGGQLRLRLEFDPDLPTTDVKYYRVSYRKHGETAETATSAPITWTAVRFPPTGDPIYSPYEIGPKTAPHGTPNLYEIHSRGNSAPGGIGFWSAQNLGGIVVNNTNAIFDTTVPAGAVLSSAPDKAGLYDLIIDLFNANGDPISLSAEHIQFFVPPSLPADTTADPAAPLGLMDGDRFVFTLHVDNNPPAVDVQEPHIGIQGAGDCGALEYTSDGQIVDIPFIAGHRNGFATYGFSIRKGGTDIFALPSTNAGVGSDTLVRHITESVGDLRGDCPVAGLRAAASVHPTATTGWGPVYGDIGDDYAFALAPEIP